MRRQTFRLRRLPISIGTIHVKTGGYRTILLLQGPARGMSPPAHWFQLHQQDACQYQTSSPQPCRGQPFATQRYCGTERKYRFQSENEGRPRSCRVLLRPGL